MALEKPFFTNKPGRVLIVATLLGLFWPGFAAAAEPNDAEDLFEMPIEQLMDVKVTSVSKKEDTLFGSPAAITVLTSEDIRRSGHRSIPEVLRMVPGIHVAKVDSNKWAITSRGFNSLYADKLLVLIDGRTVYTPLYSGVYWDVQDLMLEDVERIEVIKGPGGTLWGANAVNGVINIITKKAGDTQGTLVTAGTGTEEKGFSSLRHGGKLGENAYYRVYTKYFNRDEAVYPNGDHANDRSDALREGFRIDWDKSERDHITLQSDFYDGHSGQRVPVTVPPFGANFQSDDNVDVRGLNMLTRWARKYSDNSDMALQFYYDRTERYAIPLGESRDTFDVDFQHRFQLAEKHNLIWGLGYRHTGDNTDGSYTISFNPSSRNNELFTGFAQDEITIVDDLLKFIVGSKVEKNDYTGYEFQPNARLLWTPDEKNTVWASFARAVSTPSRVFTDMRIIYNSTPAMSINGSSDLKSQELKSYELGYRVKPKNNLLFDFSLFYNEYDHLLTMENNPTFLSKIYDNKMYGETYGAEIAAHWQVNEKMKLTGGYSFLKMQMHTENSSTDTTRISRKERESPQNIFHLNSQINLRDNLEFNTTLYHIGSVPYYSVPSYMRLDMGLTWHVSKSMDFSIIGQNLLDRAHPEFGDDGVIATEVQRGVFGELTYRF
jgi:iron complex outermembrane receptor protein